MHSTGGCANTSERSKYLEDLLKGKLGSMHIEVFCFFKIFWEDEFPEVDETNEPGSGHIYEVNVLKMKRDDGNFIRAEE